jgi:GDP-L-fucose synthase
MEHMEQQGRDSKVFVAGAGTMAGRALLRELDAEGYRNITGRSVDQPKLTDGNEVRRFFEENRPEYIFLAGGKAGGIKANQAQPAELMLDNLLVACNVIDNAYRYGAKKLVYLASSCCYPRLCPQPMRVDSLLSGELEPTSAPYAVAKIAGIKLCEAYSRQYGATFVAAIPGDVFGPGEESDPEQAHVIPALISRFYDAKLRDLPKMTLWGTGSPTRGFLFSEDLAKAWIFLMQHYDGPGPINVGGCEEISIREAARLVRDVVGFRGAVEFDATKPDGTPRKVLDPTALHQLGWRPKSDLRRGLERTFQHFLHSHAAASFARTE